MTNPILAGYQVHLTAWENDADAYATQIWSGLQSQEDVRFVLDLARQFTSHHAAVPGIGNDEIGVGAMITLVEDCLARHPGLSADVRLLFEQEKEDLNLDVISDGEDDEDGDRRTLADRWYEVICDKVLGGPVDEFYRTDYTRFCRVFEEAKVYFIPHQIEDVTNQFE